MWIFYQWSNLSPVANFMHHPLDRIFWKLLSVVASSSEFGKIVIVSVEISSVMFGVVDFVSKNSNFG